MNLRRSTIPVPSLEHIRPAAIAGRPDGYFLTPTYADKTVRGQKPPTRLVLAAMSATAVPMIQLILDLVVIVVWSIVITVLALIVVMVRTVVIAFPAVVVIGIMTGTVVAMIIASIVAGTVVRPIFSECGGCRKQRGYESECCPSEQFSAIHRILHYQPTRL
jgi:hypothetical protein